MEYIKNTLYGILIGVSNAIPGVSGGTMAVILNIYDKLLFAVSKKNIKNNLKFLVPIVFGALLGIFALSKLIVPLQKSHPMILGFCFLGVIIGSLPIVYRHAVPKGARIKITNICISIFTFSIMLAMFLMPQNIITNATLEEYGGMSLQLMFILVVFSGIAAIAMIIPGISGSLVMLLLGIYTIVIEGVCDLNMLVLVPTGIGTLLGLLVGIKVIKNFMIYHPQALYFAVLGLIVGSLFMVYPGFSMNLEGVISIIFGLVFLILAYFSSIRRI